MAEAYEFVYEHRSWHRVLVVFGTIAFIIFCVLMVANYGESLGGFIHNVPFLDTIIDVVRSDTTLFNARGVFYVTFLGDLFFNPIPPEVYFYGALLKGAPHIPLSVAALIGCMLAHVVNYLIGRRFSVFFIHLASKKSLYKTRRAVNKYGGYAVLIFNILPLPSPLLTFALGIARYKVSRLFVFLFIGNVIKHAAIVAFFLWSGKFL
jgi:membrane protein YqaA with SNARE-associated domain